MRTLVRVATILLLAAAGCAASAPVRRTPAASGAVPHRRWTGCPAYPPGAPQGSVWQSPVEGSATRLPRLGDDFRPVAVIVCTDASQKRADGSLELLWAEYRGTATADLTAALRLSDAPPTGEPCPEDEAFPQWFALLDAQGRWVRPGTPTDGCGVARRELLHAVARLTLTMVGSRPVRELRSARAAAAGCDQEDGDRVAEFSEPDSPALGGETVPFVFARPVRLCVYRERAGRGDFVRGGVLSPQHSAALGRLLHAPRAGAPCAGGATLVARLADADDPYREGTVRVQLDGCRQMLLEPAAAGPVLARADPALVALLSGR